jgi:hypothetical protein
MMEQCLLQRQRLLKLFKEDIMKRIKQFRYYSSTSSNNYPSLSNYYGILSAGNLFASHGGVSQLGI